MLNTINEEAILYTKDKRRIGNGRVIKKGENTVTLLFYKKLPIALMDELLIDFTSDVYGLLTYICQPVTFELSKTSSLDKEYYVSEFQILELANILQRRRDIKVKVSFSCTITLIDNEGEPLINPKTGKPQTYQVRIKDISASGILMVTDQNFTIGQKFTFIFDQTNTPIEITSEILRTQEEKEDLTGYGCHFVDVPPAKEAQIRQHVFKLQIMTTKLADN